MKPFARLPLLSALALVSALAVSCGNGEEQPAVPPALHVRTNPAPNKAGSQFLDVTASGDWTISISEGTWATVSPDYGSGSVSVVLQYEENRDPASRRVVLTLVARNGEVSVEFSQDGSSSTPSDPGPIAGADVAPVKWLELPETLAGDGLEFFSHRMDFEGKSVRNYSYDWNYDKLIASWVAYPMIPAYARKGTSRTDNWALDPLLPREKQSVTLTGFDKGNAGWYSRGHQLPSADRLFSFAANSSTFYGTNITPQDNDFNGGIWANLEMAVRSWANKADTVYVTTGCFGDTGYYVLDDDGKHVAVPQGYYKAVLCKTLGSSGFGAGGYAGCAVCFDDVNHSPSESLKNFAMSIDDLEKKLGMNFFVNLPEAIGKEKADQVEAENPQTVSWWW
jgi:endonuclease G